MLARNYGLSKSETGSAFGMIYLIAGTIGEVMAGPFLASRLQRTGYADANVRTVLIASIVSILPATLAPLMGSAEHIAGFVAHCFHKYDVLGHHGGELSVDHAQ